MKVAVQHAQAQARVLLWLPQVVDFQWHPTDKFTMVSVSEHDVGGSLQIWRINDLIYLPADEAIRELEAHR